MGTRREPVSDGAFRSCYDATDMISSETAALKVKEYHTSIGGTPEPGSTKGKKKGAQKRTASEALESPAPSSTKKRGYSRASEAVRF